MKVEKLDRVVVYVSDIEESKAVYSDLLGAQFDEIPFGDVDPARVVAGGAEAETGEEGSGPLGAWRVAISRIGLELIEGATPPGTPPFVACYHFKVSDYEGAKAHMAAKGQPLATDITLGELREAIYRPQGNDGPMMGLVSYPDEYVMDSIKRKP